MIYVICAFFLIPLWGFSWWLLQRLLGTQSVTVADAAGQKPSATPAGTYADWVVHNLEEMFYKVNPKVVRWCIWGVVAVAGLGGFFLPATLPQVNRNAVEEAMALNKQGDYSGALSILRDYEDEDSPLVYNEIGVALLGQRSYEDAANALRRALALEPTYGKAHANLGAVYKMMDNQERMNFQRSRSNEMAKYPLDAERVWGMSGDITQGLGLRLAIAAVCMFVAYRIPRFMVNWLRNRRMAKYDEQLPDALIMASNGLRAGFSLVQALDIVANETTPPLSQEFQLVLKEHRLGADLDTALEHLARRVPSMDTRIFVNSMNILREVGGNLTEIFDTLAETIKERKRVQSKIKSMTAEGTTQAYILSVLPVVLCFIMYKLNPESTGLLFTTTLGWVFVAVMAIMEIVGLVWMLKMVKVRI